MTKCSFQRPPFKVLTPATTAPRPTPKRCHMQTTGQTSLEACPSCLIQRTQCLKHRLQHAAAIFRMRPPRRIAEDLRATILAGLRLLHHYGTHQFVNHCKNLLVLPPPSRPGLGARTSRPKPESESEIENAIWSGTARLRITLAT